MQRIKTTSNSDVLLNPELRQHWHSALFADLRTCKRQTGSVISAHAVDSTHTGRRRGAQVNIRIRGGIAAPAWAKKSLTQRHRAAADVAANEIRVHRFEN